MQLIAISYYSAPNSRVLKYINVTWNDRCFSLNHDQYYVNSPEDQIAVSFICNQYLQIHRACMRPHVDISLTDFYADAANLSRGPTFPAGCQFKSFNLTVTGRISISGKEYNE